MYLVYIHTYLVESQILMHKKVEAKRKLINIKKQSCSFLLGLSMTINLRTTNSE